MHRRHHAISLQDAANASDTLLALSKRIALSQACFEAVLANIPAGLRASIVPGPIEQVAEITEWCLLVPSSAAASKLRQLLPDMLLGLQKAQLDVGKIRIKVQQNRTATVGLN
jgi:hypothetical protein